MPLRVPESLKEEHEELHKRLSQAVKVKGEVGTAAKQAAEVLHPHFEKETELALTVIGVAKDLGQGKVSPEFAKALELAERFEAEYQEMLREHVKIVKALDKLEKAARAAKETEVMRFVRDLKLHAKTEEELTYPAVLMAARLLRQTQQVSTSQQA